VTGNVILMMMPMQHLRKSRRNINIGAKYVSAVIYCHK